MKKFVKGIFLMLVLALVAISGYTLGKMSFPENGEAPTEATENVAIEEPESRAQEILKGMSLSEKVYQLLFVTPEEITGVGTCIEAGEATKKALEEKPVGGIVYFAKNFKSREQTKRMISNTQSYSKIPLFISVDEEGGRVARLGRNESMGTTLLPPMGEIGLSKDAKAAYDAGVTLAKDLTALGFNMDFAPVADVIVDERNSEIGDRSFGTDPVVVSQMVGEIVRGMEENNLSATLKHFPGHGSTYQNSHTGYSESDRTYEELLKEELLPFKKGIENGADFVMVSHMTLVNATEEKVPASMSYEVITGLLINNLGFEGVVITDSLEMGAITEKYDSGQSAVKAILAGADMLLMSPDASMAHDAVMKAVEEGIITEERIDKSVLKILDIKEKKGMLK